MNNLIGATSTPAKKEINPPRFSYHPEEGVAVHRLPFVTKNPEAEDSSRRVDWFCRFEFNQRQARSYMRAGVQSGQNVQLDIKRHAGTNRCYRR